MFREWFQIARRPLDKPQYDAFADPLEREEWQGLGWALPLLARLAEPRAVISYPAAERTRREAAGECRRPANA